MREITDWTWLQTAIDVDVTAKDIAVAETMGAAVCLAVRRALAGRIPDGLELHEVEVAPTGDLWQRGRVGLEIRGRSPLGAMRQQVWWHDGLLGTWLDGVMGLAPVVFRLEPTRLWVGQPSPLSEMMTVRQPDGSWRDVPTLAAERQAAGL